MVAEGIVGIVIEMVLRQVGRVNVERDVRVDDRPLILAAERIRIGKILKHHVTGVFRLKVARVDAEALLHRVGEGVRKTEIPLEQKGNQRREEHALHDFARLHIGGEGGDLFAGFIRHGVPVVVQHDHAGLSEAGHDDRRVKRTVGAAFRDPARRGLRRGKASDRRRGQKQQDADKQRNHAHRRLFHKLSAPFLILYTDSITDFF